MGKLNSQANWTDADADRLRAAIEAAGSDLFSVARTNSLSNAQILELEQGGDSYFYSASIKYNAGKKLLNSYDGQTEYDRLSEETRSQTHKDAAVVENFLEESSQHLQPQKNIPRSNAPKPSLYLAAIAAICIAVAFVIYPIYKNKTNTEKTIASPQVSQLETLTESTYSARPSNPDSATAIQIQAINVESLANDCVWSENPPNLSTQNATKDGNYVYLVAIKELVVCIKDKTNKVKIVNLKANETQNISGVSPLNIQS